jgi:pimeloyl-ACP methyl ester carboxylesterase
MERLERGPGEWVAYERHPGEGPEVMFLGGFASDMTGTKALYLEAHCRAKGRAFTRFDYRGHGASSGRFADGTIGGWTADALAVLDSVVEGPVVLVGSSMGGWIMLLLALARPERVKGLVGIAVAPDFTERLIRDVLTPEEAAVLARDGVLLQPSEYGEPLPITTRLLDEGRDHLLLEAPIAIGCPVHLLHGQADADVPFGLALELADRLESRQVTLELVKDGDHRLSREADLRRLTAALERMLEAVG